MSARPTTKVVITAALAIGLGACMVPNTERGKDMPATALPDAPAGALTVAAAQSAAPPGGAPKSPGPVLPQSAALAPPTAEQRSAGAQLAAQGAGSVAACSACHGAQGEGNAAANFPRLSGQSFTYLNYQLESYADDKRKNPVMGPIAKAMSPEQRRAGAAYYASLAASAAAPPPASIAASQAARGRSLAEVGDEARKVQACANCHGAGGIGEGDTYPSLAGQHAGVLKAFLVEWQDGSRDNDPSLQMPSIAKALSAADIDAVAAFYAGRPPAPRRDMADSTVATSGRTIVSGPRGNADQSTRGIGSEQGAPLTGGAQGPGGGGGGSGAGPTGSPSGAANGGNAQPGSPAASRPSR